jgi:serine/threonine protein kinase
MASIYQPAEGDRVGRYLVYRKIGQGGMASVFLAKVINVAADPISIMDEGGLWSGGAKEHTHQLSEELDPWVALKFLHPHHANNPKSVQRFIEEIGVASQLKHPHICHVLDLGNHQGVPYLAMPYLRGQVVSQLIYEEEAPQVPLVVAVSIAIDLAEGLSHAHSLADSEGRPLNLIHRDISPHNAFVEYSGVAKVLDFGIARIKSQQRRTTTGHTLGKIAYMAPEQFDDKNVDQRADLWALSVTLWELFTQSPLFEGTHQMKTMYQIINAPLSPPSEHREDVPEEIDRVVIDGLSRDLDHRTPTAISWSAPLVQWIEAQGIDRAERRQRVRQWLLTHYPPPIDQSHSHQERDSSAQSIESPERSLSAQDLERPKVDKQEKEEEITANIEREFERAKIESDHIKTYPKRRYGMGRNLIIQILIGGAIAAYLMWWASAYFNGDHTLSTPESVPKTRLILGNPQRPMGGLILKTAHCEAQIYDETDNKLLGNTPFNQPLEAKIHALVLTPTRKSKRRCHTRKVLVEITAHTIVTQEVDMRSAQP